VWPWVSRYFRKPSSPGTLPSSAKFENDRFWRFFRQGVERRALMLGQHLDDEGLLDPGTRPNIPLNFSLPFRGKVGDARRQSEVAPFGLW